MPHRTLSLSQTARLIRIPERELVHLVQRDEIPHQRRGDELVFEKRLVNEWVQRHILSLPAQSLIAHHRDAVADRTSQASEDALVPRLFRPEWIQPALRSRTKPAILRDMVALAAATGHLYDDATFLRELEERERIESTAISGGVALLHARYHDPYHAAESFVVLGRAAHDIFFGALDGARTDLFFLICCTDDAQHLHTLARLCTLAQRTALLPDLRAAPEAGAMYAALLQAESDLLHAL